MCLICLELCWKSEDILEAADPCDEASLLSTGGLPGIPGKIQYCTV
jgi:hypothetical protein